MEITEIKNIKKLQEMLKSALDEIEIEYLKKCCTKTGEELAKYTFPYDYKEKNLVIQAKKINEEFERREKALEDIKEYTRKQFCDNCEDIGSTEYTCHCEYCEYQEYFDIISRAKDCQ